MEISSGNNHCILVVDDNEFNRDGMALYLDNHGFGVLQAGDAAGALELAGQERPWAAVVDIVIPQTATGRANIDQSVGLQLVRQLKSLDPTMGVVIFSAHEDRGGEVWDLVRNGARGIAYLMKGIRPERLLAAIHETVAGLVILDGVSPTSRRRMGEELLDQLSAEERPWVVRAITLVDDLTPQERRVALRLANSQTNQGIATAMKLSPKTVEAHIGKIYKKLGLNEVDERAPQLRKAGLLAKAFMVYELLRQGFVDD